jgi:hypothetical protein
MGVDHIGKVMVRPRPGDDATGGPASALVAKGFFGAPPRAEDRHEDRHMKALDHLGECGKPYDTFNTPGFEHSFKHLR